MFFHAKNMKSENNSPWFKLWFMLMHTQSIACATVDSQCLEYLGYITLPSRTVDEKTLKYSKEFAFSAWASI